MKKLQILELVILYIIKLLAVLSILYYVIHFNVASEYSFTIGYVVGGLALIFQNYIFQNYIFKKKQNK